MWTCWEYNKKKNVEKSIVRRLRDESKSVFKIFLSHRLIERQCDRKWNTSKLCLCCACDTRRQKMTAYDRQTSGGSDGLMHLKHVIPKNNGCVSRGRRGWWAHKIVQYFRLGGVRAGQDASNKVSKHKLQYTFTINRYPNTGSWDTYKIRGTLNIYQYLFVHLRWLWNKKKNYVFCTPPWCKRFTCDSNEKKKAATQWPLIHFFISYLSGARMVQLV